MAEPKRNPNPLISSTPSETLDNALYVLSFLQHQSAGEFACEPGQKIKVGEALIFETVVSALGSLQPHLRQQLMQQDPHHG